MSMYFQTMNGDGLRYDIVREVVFLFSILRSNPWCHKHREDFMQCHCLTPQKGERKTAKQGKPVRGIGGASRLRIRTRFSRGSLAANCVSISPSLQHLAPVRTPKIFGHFHLRTKKATNESESVIAVLNRKRRVPSMLERGGRKMNFSKTASTIFEINTWEK